MPRFRFRLATLLKLREAARDERRRHLAQALEAMQILQGQIADNAREQRELQGLLRTGAAGAIDVDRLLDLQRYAWQLRHDEQTMQTQLGRVGDEAEKRRLALVEADRQVKTLEQLREKQFARHRQEEERRETFRLDEIATSSAARREAAR